MFFRVVAISACGTLMSADTLCLVKKCVVIQYLQGLLLEKTENPCCFTFGQHPRQLNDPRIISH